MNNYLKEAEATANWWVEQVSKPTFDNGEKNIGSVMAMMMQDSMVMEIVTEKKERFKSELIDRITAKLTTGKYVYLNVDYDPCEVLTECANLAEIPLTNFPIKSSTTVSVGLVKARLGRSGDSEIIYGQEAAV